MRRLDARAAALVGGTLAVALAGTAAGATGSALILGQTNTADAQTSIDADTSGVASVRIQNDAGQPALSLFSSTGVAPLRVNRDTKVANLNADKLDDLDSAALQRRVAATCPGGSSIREIGADGTVSCETDDDTAPAAGVGLEANGNELSVREPFRLPQGCPTGANPKWDGNTGTWGCEPGTTLDQAYREGGAGDGRTITADAGAVRIAGSGGLHVSGRVAIGREHATRPLDVAGDARFRAATATNLLVSGGTAIVDLDLVKDSAGTATTAAARIRMAGVADQSSHRGSISFHTRGEGDASLRPRLTIGQDGEVTFRRRTAHLNFSSYDFVPEGGGYQYTAAFELSNTGSFAQSYGATIDLPDGVRMDGFTVRWCDMVQGTASGETRHLRLGMFRRPISNGAVSPVLIAETTSADGTTAQNCTERVVDLPGTGITVDNATQFYWFRVEFPDPPGSTVYQDLKLRLVTLTYSFDRLPGVIAP